MSAALAQINMPLAGVNPEAPALQRSEEVDQNAINGAKALEAEARREATKKRFFTLDDKEKQARAKSLELASKISKGLTRTAALGFFGVGALGYLFMGANIVTMGLFAASLACVGISFTVRGEAKSKGDKDKKYETAEQAINYLQGILSPSNGQLGKIEDFVLEPKRILYAIHKITSGFNRLEGPEQKQEVEELVDQLLLLAESYKDKAAKRLKETELQNFDNIIGDLGNLKDRIESDKENIT